MITNQTLEGWRKLCDENTDNNKKIPVLRPKLVHFINEFRNLRAVKDAAIVLFDVVNEGKKFDSNKDRFMGALEDLHRAVVKNGGN